MTETWLRVGLSHRRILIGSLRVRALCYLKGDVQAVYTVMG